MTEVQMQRVSTKVADFGEGGGGFKFKEGARIRIVGAKYERRHQEARKAKDGKEIPAKDDTVLKLDGVLPGVDEETVVSHVLGCGNVLWPSEDGLYLVSEKPVQLNRGSGAGRFLASLVEVGAADGSYTEEDDAARDVSIDHLVGMEFNAGYNTVAGDGDIKEYKALVATAVWVRPGGEGAASEDTVAGEVAQALKAAIDATKGSVGLPFLAAGTALQKSDLSTEAKGRVVELLRNEEFIQQGVADQMWRFDGKKKLFMKSGA